MFVRSYKNKIIEININDYSSEKKFYIALWKIKYNVDISKNSKKFDILQYI